MAYSIRSLSKTAGMTGLAALGAAVALTGATPAVAEDTAEEAEMTRGEQRLARLLEGRVAGEPQRCIRQRSSDRMQVIDDTAYVYGSGRTIYVQRTRNPEDISKFDTLVVRRFSNSQLCRLDTTHTIDPVNGFYTGAVLFEDFIPYTRVEKEEG